MDRDIILKSELSPHDWERGVNAARAVLCQLPEDSHDRYATWLQIEPVGREPYHVSGFYTNDLGAALRDYLNRCADLHVGAFGDD